MEEDTIVAAERIPVPCRPPERACRTAKPLQLAAKRSPAEHVSSGAGCLPLGCKATTFEVTVFTVLFAALAREHLDDLRAFERNQVLDEIEAQLPSTPHVPTARRKRLVGATP